MQQIQQQSIHDSDRPKNRLGLLPLVVILVLLSNLVSPISWAELKVWFNFCLWVAQFLLGFGMGLLPLVWGGLVLAQPSKHPRREYINRWRNLLTLCIYILMLCIYISTIIILR